MSCGHTLKVGSFGMEVYVSITPEESNLQEVMVQQQDLLFHLPWVTAAV